MNKLKALRESKEMSREKLAGDAGCSLNSIRDYESGKAIPRADLALRIAKVLDTTVEKIWGDK